jgi:hypothetical protein
MTTKKRFAIAAAGAAALSVGFLTPASTATANGLLDGCHVLMANQVQPAGTVCVTQTSSTSIDVVFTTDGGWLMTQAHLAVATEPTAIPQGKKNPIPGQFPYSHVDQAGFTTYTFDVPDLVVGTPNYIAAHAVVWDPASDTTMTAVSGTGTSLTDSTFTSVTGPAAPANEPGVTGSYPNCAAQSPSDLTPSLWDKNIIPKPASFDRFNTAGADWIWDTTQIPLDEAISGEVNYFTQTLTVPGLPVAGGDVYIAADNAFQVAVNGSNLGNQRFGPGFFATDELREDVGLGPQLGDWGVASQGWQPVGHYTFTPVQGANVLNVTAANEYQDLGPNPLEPLDSYLGWNGSAYTTQVTPDPTPNLTNKCTNPGGVIFMASVDYFATSQTAWGAYGTDGEGFGGTRWAAYFTFTLS